MGEWEDIHPSPPTQSGLARSRRLQAKVSPAERAGAQRPGRLRRQRGDKARTKAGAWSLSSCVLAPGPMEPCAADGLSSS